MGKYMKKSQISADVALMELSQSTSSGVRTRAKTLALQRLNASSSDTSSSSYLQLRSRCLEKPPLVKDSKNSAVDFENSDASRGKKLNCKSASRTREKGGGDFGESELQCEAEDLGVEVSLGDNYLDFELRERSTRESTPCSLIRDPETIGTPGSTTRPASSTMANHRRVTSNILRNIPTSHEMEEFFTYAEQEQQRLFIDKYNFDIVNELPLSGRYEWVQVIP